MQSNIFLPTCSIGSAIGWFSGEKVYRRHHDPELGGGDWETYAESRDESPARHVTRTGSPYVELDSWIYPAIERLAALGYIHSEFLGMRPWTRIECAHLVEEAGDRIGSRGWTNSAEAAPIYNALEKEFEGDLAALGRWSDETAATIGVAIFRHDGDQRPAIERQLSFRPNDHQQLRPSVSGRI